MTTHPIRLAIAVIGFTPALVRAQAVSDSGTFVVRHARDTVATERFSRTDTKIEGTVTLRNAKHTSQRWSAVVAPDATLPLIEVTIREGSDTGGRSAKVVQRARVIFKEDSVAVDELGGQGIQTRLFATERGAMPYLNLSFALLEQAVRRARCPQILRGSHSSIWAAVRRQPRQFPAWGPILCAWPLGTWSIGCASIPAGRVLGGRIPVQDVIAERR